MFNRMLGRSGGGSEPPPGRRILTVTFLEAKDLQPMDKKVSDPHPDRFTSSLNFPIMYTSICASRIMHTSLCYVSTVCELEIGKC